MQWEATVKISEWCLPDWQPKVLNLRTCQEDPGLWVCAPDSTKPVELLAAAQVGPCTLHPWPATPEMLWAALWRMGYAERGVSNRNTLDMTDWLATANDPQIEWIEVRLTCIDIILSISDICGYESIPWKDLDRDLRSKISWIIMHKKSIWTNPCPDGI